MIHIRIDKHVLAAYTYVCAERIRAGVYIQPYMYT